MCFQKKKKKQLKFKAGHLNECENPFLTLRSAGIAYASDSYTIVSDWVRGLQNLQELPLLV